MGGDVHDMSYYGKCMVGGLLACGLTHTAIVPLDLVKCRKQVHLSKFTLIFKVDSKMYTSLGAGLSSVVKTEGWGPKGLFLGWGPTLIGYSMQGLGKFGFYEMFKDVYKNIVGKRIFLTRKVRKTLPNTKESGGQ